MSSTVENEQIPEKLRGKIAEEGGCLWRKKNQDGEEHAYFVISKLVALFDFYIMYVHFFDISKNSLYCLKLL